MITEQELLERSIPEPNTGCWLWLKDYTTRGYARYRRKKVARLVLGLDNSPDFALHTCDTPACVNPDHLYVGDHAQNMRDRSQRGRVHQQWGQKNRKWATKITAEMATAIRQDPRSLRVVAAEYGLNYTAVSLIRLRKRWTKVP